MNRIVTLQPDLSVKTKSKIRLRLPTHISSVQVKCKGKRLEKLIAEVELKDRIDFLFSPLFLIVKVVDQCVSLVHQVDKFSKKEFLTLSLLFGFLPI